MQEFFSHYWLDIVTTLLGLSYIVLQYKESVWLWFVGFVMQLLGVVLYYQKGLYADCAMEFYYIGVTIYGFILWTFGKTRQTTTKNVLPITHLPAKIIPKWTIFILLIWGIIYYILAYHTNSNVPFADSFTTALSVVGIWALARKYVEQWLIWIAVDIVTSILYFYKDIPFKASLYALYVVIAIFGYRKWKNKAKQEC